jgi:hypothetical protein
VATSFGCNGISKGPSIVLTGLKAAHAKAGRGPAPWGCDGPQGWGTAPMVPGGGRPPHGSMGARVVEIATFKCAHEDGRATRRRGCDPLCTQASNKMKTHLMSRSNPKHETGAGVGVASLHTKICSNENPLDVMFHMAASKHETAGAGGSCTPFPWSHYPTRGMGLETGMHGLGVIAL